MARFATGVSQYLAAESAQAIRIIGTGTATLVGGLATVLNADVTANTIALVTPLSGATVTLPLKFTPDPGVGFVIGNATGSDSGDVKYVLVEP